MCFQFGGYFNVLIEGRWLGWQQLATLEDLKGLLTSKAADVTQNPESYKSGQIYSVEGNTTVENGHPYTADWTHLTYFVYGDENAENGYKNVIGIDYRGKVYRKSQCWNYWTDWVQMVTIEDLESKADKFYTIFNKNVIQDEDLIGSAFTNKSWCGVGLNLEHAPVSNWLNYLCLDAASTGSDINHVFAMEINGSNPHCYFTNDTEGKKWKRFLFVEDAKEIISNPSILINSYFKNPVNQRGKSTYSGSIESYTIDRWYKHNGTVFVKDGYIELYRTGHENSFCQFVELDEVERTFTFSVCTTENRIYSNTQYIKDVDNTYGYTEVEDYKIRMSYDSTRKLLKVEIYCDGSNDSAILKLKWAKLEYGEIATPFVPPDPTLELLKCQRYFYQIMLKDYDDVIYIGNAVCISKNSDIYFRLSFQLPVYMRTLPTVSAKGLEYTVQAQSLPGQIKEVRLNSSYNHKTISLLMKLDTNIDPQYLILVYVAGSYESNSYIAFDAEIY